MPGSRTNSTIQQENKDDQLHSSQNTQLQNQIQNSPPSSCWAYPINISLLREVNQTSQCTGHDLRQNNEAYLR